MGWLIYATWGALSTFVVWLMLAQQLARRREARRLGSGISEVDRLLAEAYPEIPPDA